MLILVENLKIFGQIENSTIKSRTFSINVLIFVLFSQINKFIKNLRRNSVLVF